MKFTECFVFVNPDISRENKNVLFQVLNIFLLLVDMFPKIKWKSIKTENKEYKIVLISKHLIITIIKNFVGHIKLLTLVTYEYSCTESIQIPLGRECRASMSPANWPPDHSDLQEGLLDSS